LLKKAYIEQMALFNVIGTNIFLAEDPNQTPVAAVLEVSGVAKRTVSKAVKVAKLLQCHRVLNAADENEVVDLGAQWGVIDRVQFEGLTRPRKQEVMLHFLMYFSVRVDYCRKKYKNDITPLLTQFENAPPCSLHTSMRVPENVVTHALQMVEDDASFTRKVKTDILGMIQATINHTLGSNHAVHITITEGRVETVSMTAVKMMKVVEIFPALIELVSSTYSFVGL